MIDDPIISVIYFCIAAYFLKLWYGDLRAAEKPKNAFPGAEYAPMSAVIIAVVGILVLLGAYTGAEIAMGVESEQSTLGIFALFSMIAAAFVEELIFRGYLVVENRGRLALIGGIVGFSIVFALIHSFFWSYTDESGLVFNFTAKASLDTFFIFANSLWFYAVRFLPFNPKRSLIPCIAAHLAYNLGVFAVKMIQGFA